MGPRSRPPPTGRALLVGLVGPVGLAGLVLFAAPARGAEQGATTLARHGPLASGERLIAVLQTNDLQGGIEGRSGPDGERYGGLALFGGIVDATRRGLERQFGARAGMLVLDGGDQFRGELLSNINEGVLAFSAMDLVGYDAAVPGNHDYDLGPVGWLVDRYDPSDASQHPRGALDRARSHARFPLLAANVYAADSIADGTGRRVAPDSPEVDWSAARRAFPSHRIVRAAGLDVALIGLDHPETPRMTHAENVRDLVFRDMEPAYLEVRRELEGRADVFVLVMHYGDTPRDTPDHVAASTLVRRLVAHRDGFSGAVVDAVVGGHTHRRNDLRVEGVPIVQSFSRGTHFGRIDLIYDVEAGRVRTDRTRTYAGLAIHGGRCDPAAEAFCGPDREFPGRIRIEGVPVVADPRILELVARERERVAPTIDRTVARAERPIWTHRNLESPLANFLTDSLRAGTGADVALIHTRAIRAPLPPGRVRYEDLYRVLPYGSRAVTVGPVGVESLLALLERSASACGGSGALMQSGLRVRFVRDCAARGKDGTDPEARLLRVETLDGEVLFDRESGARAPAGRRLLLATLSTHGEGRAAAEGLEDLPTVADFGIFREMVADRYAEEPALLGTHRDRRWSAQPPPRVARDR